VEPKFEEQFTVFIDLLGFSKAVKKIDATTPAGKSTILEILDLLSSLSELRGEFELKSEGSEYGIKTVIKPTISTFSDSIVISYPLKPTIAELEVDEQMAIPSVIARHTQSLIAKIAAMALRFGFLVRGGAAIGNLYHAGGVVFGKASLDAFDIETRTSHYPRVVLSQEILERTTMKDGLGNSVVKDDHDGLYHFDYFRILARSDVIPSDRRGAGRDAWISSVYEIVDKERAHLGSEGQLDALAKWNWFKSEFRSGLERSKSFVPRGYACAVASPEDPGVDSNAQRALEARMR
jgi:hypothetical protein